MTETTTRLISAERRDAVDRARRAWIDRLIDRSRRNNLLYFRDLRAGTLDLTAAPPDPLAALLAGEAVPLSKLVPVGEDEARMAERLREIGRKARANLEEKGLETLFLAVGMATWTPDDGGRPPEAPVLLLPVSISLRGRDARTAVLQRDGDSQVNAVLLFELATAHGQRLDADALIGLGDGENGNGGSGANNGNGADGIDVEAVIARLVAGASGVPGFAVRGRVVLGNFAFQKMAMVKDLTERLDAMAEHDVIAAVAGDVDAAVSLRPLDLAMDPRAFDRVSPDDEFFILDSDPSQLSAIASVMAGYNVVVFGPPGTGKSQTIANLMAGLAAEGKRVLFVAEKRAALEAVYKRLEGAGVGHLALDLHGADIKRRVVIDGLRRARDTVQRSPEVPAQELHRRFVERRDRLIAHDERMHAPRRPSGLSAFEMQGMLLRTPEHIRPETRWRGSDLARLDRESAEAILSGLRDLRAFGDLLLETSPSAWSGARLEDGETARSASDVARTAHQSLWPALRMRLESAASASGLPFPATFDAAEGMGALLEDVNATLERYGLDLFDNNLTAWAAALSPAARGFWPHAWAFLASGAFRRARKGALAHRTAGPSGVATLHAEVAAAADAQARWRALQPGGIPKAVALPDGLKTALHGAGAAVDALSPLLPRGDLRHMSFDEAGQMLSDLAADTVTPYRIPESLALQKKVTTHGGEAMLAEIVRRRLAPEEWEQNFTYAWIASCYDEARAQDPGLGAFHGRTHDETAAEFRRLDEERLRVASARLRREHGERAIEAMDAHPDQALLVNRELEKKSRHLPLRDLLAKAPDVLTALCPCWMASPLSVSQLLAADRRYFDVVVFDEASQVLPEDAVAALLRGARVVVAGDEHQLPPTTFFADAADEETEAALPTAGFESLLTVVKPYFAQGALRVHYRSRDESLIAFSNERIYKPHDHEMVTFPGPSTHGAVSHVLVSRSDGAEADEESSAEEARRVVDLVLEHARTRPNESLGVIAMGLKHANRVQAALDAALAARPEMDAFFDPEQPERFFVKNLERVQGDERDAIILTVGYGKDASGRLRHFFGPLNAADGSGYRRLNVAITRARSRMTLVSSFGHKDMDPAKCTSEGPRLLRAYLEYAAGGGTRHFSDITEDATKDTATGDSGAFEADVREALAEHGIRCLARFGASGTRMDLAAVHPVRPDRLALAIESDGEGYHDQLTARMRDRLRPQRLEALGWRFHRIWSTDWFLRRDEEIARAVAAYSEAVDHADRVDAGEADPGAPPEQPAATTGAEAPAPPRPRVPRRESIADYAESEIDALVEWLDDSGCLTEEEIIARMVRELGFARRGARIEAAVRASLSRIRPAPEPEW